MACFLRRAAAAAAALAACGAAAGRDECSVGAGAAEAESEQMRTELVQTRSRILGGQSAGGGDHSPAAPSLPTSGQWGAALATRRYGALLRGQAGLELSTEQRVGLIVPVAWFHVPKTGTSICNTFYHTPGICPGFSADWAVTDSSDGGSWDSSFGDKNDVCPGAFSKSYGMKFHGKMGAGLDPPNPFTQPYSHIGVGGPEGQFYQMNAGHFVTMLRQPEQRIISMYKHYGAIPLFVDNLQTRSWPYEVKQPELREYAEWNAGCTVRQLTMDNLVPCDALPLPTSGDVSLAKTVLQDGFAFVGITEQWALSVCLFRAMFGGECVKSDLLDTRPGVDYNNSFYDTSELQGWVDDLDGPLYDEAVSIFESTRKVYGVEPSSCEALCNF